MRLATFNLENLDLPPKADVPIEARARVLRPALARLDADIVCLQEVNGQREAHQKLREPLALEQLIAGTRYESYHMVSSTGEHGLADVHNLVTLSRFPIVTAREVRHDFVPPVTYLPKTAVPPEASPAPLRFDRPLLMTEHDLGGGARVTVVNLHLRAPLAASIRGQKLSAYSWRTVGGWAEGFFMSAVRRDGQALELRLLVEDLFASEPARLLAVAGDFNAEDRDVPLKIAIGAPEDTGNAELSARSLVLLDRSVSSDLRWSVLHHGRPQMLDHILVSHALHGAFRSLEIHNEVIGDEAVGFARGFRPAGSSHAAVVAEFDL